MRYRLYISIALLLAVSICKAQSYPENILFKNFATQVNSLDSLDRTFGNTVIETITTRLTELEDQADKKHDEQFKYLARLLKYRKQLNSGSHSPSTFENDALTLLKEVENKPYLKTEALQFIGKYYWNTKKYSEAFEYYTYAYNNYSAYTIYEFPHKADHLADFATVFYHFRDWGTAKRYLREMYNTIPHEKIDNLVSKTNTLALCYSRLEEYDSSAYYFNKAEQVAITNKDTVWLGIISGNLATNYFNQKKYDSARILFERDIYFALHKGDRTDAALSMGNLAEIYLIQNDKKKALETIQQAYEIIKEKSRWKNTSVVKNLYPSIAKVYAATGNMALAYSFLDSGMAALNSDLKEKNALVLAGAQHKVEVNTHMAELQKKEGELVIQKRLRNTFLGGFTIVLLLSTVVLIQKRKLTKSKRRSDELLLNILPSETAEELKDTGFAKAKSYDTVTVLFTDFKNFTETSQSMSAQDLVQEINYCYSSFDKIISKYGIEKIKTIGDSYMCAGGLPVVSKTHATDVVSVAIEMSRFIQEEKEKRQKNNKIFFEMRIGVHSGPVVAGIVGIKKFAYDIWGDTVNIASRMESSGEAGKINISETTYELVKDKFNCTYRGEIDAKNKGVMKMYFVNIPNPELTGKSLKEVSETEFSN